MSAKKITVPAMLTAVSIIIPIFFPKIIIPPFTATLFSHVPIMLAICISTRVAVLVTVGTSVGFMFAFSSMPFGYLRSFTHIIFVLLACYLLKRNCNVYVLVIITGLVHAVFETVIILLVFFPVNVSPMYAILTLSIGAFLHHIVDAFATTTLVLPLKHFKLINKTFILLRKKPY